MEYASCFTFLVFFRFQAVLNRGARAARSLLASLNPAAPLGRLEKIGAAILFGQHLLEICRIPANRSEDSQNRAIPIAEVCVAISRHPIISLIG